MANNNNGTAFYAIDGSAIILSSPSLSGNSTDYNPSSNTEGNGNSYITVT